MIAYLKRGETVIFSRESLLKQEEALAELDVSIDEFISKLEQAEKSPLASPTETTGARCQQPWSWTPCMTTWQTAPHHEAQ